MLRGGAASSSGCQNGRCILRSETTFRKSVFVIRRLLERCARSLATSVSARHPYSRGPVAVLLASIPFVMALGVWWLSPKIAFDTDSLRYLTASPMRTATYPLFLRFAYGPAILPIQLLLFASALSWLAFYSCRYLGWVVAAGTTLAIGANPFLWQLQSTVMSEALTTPLLTLVVGCLIGFVTTSRRLHVIAAALFCGIAVSARPSLLPLILTPVCAIYLAPHLNRRKNLIVVLLGVSFAPVAVERLYSHAVHGNSLTSPMGRQLFMKAAIIEAPPTPPASTSVIDRTLSDELNQEYAPVRQLISATTDRDIRWILLPNYEACAGWGCFNDTWNAFRLPEAELHKRLFRIGLRRLESNPLDYLKLTAGEYPRMWLLHPRKLPSIAPKYNAFLAAKGPIPFQQKLGEVGEATPPSAQSRIYYVNRAIFLLVGIIAALMTLGLLFWHRHRLARLSLSLLLGTQGVLVFSSFLGSGQVRYSMGMWPTIAAAEVLGAAAILSALARQLLQSSSSPGREST